MDELIVKVMQDIGINEKFIKNPSAYSIIKHYIRIKLNDFYSYHLLNEAKEDDESCTEQEIIEGLRNENKNCSNIDNLLNGFEISMIKYYKTKMKDPIKWNEVVGKIKHNMKILDRFIRISTDENKLYISYKSTFEKETVLMMFNEYNGNIDVESAIQVSEGEEQDQKNFSMIYEKYALNGERLKVSIKNYGNKLEKQDIKKQVNKLRKKYYDNISRKLDDVKNKSGAKVQKVIAVISNRLKLEQNDYLYKNSNTKENDLR